MSARVRTIAPVLDCTDCTGAAAAAAAVNATTSVVECVWADGANVAGVLLRAVYEIVGMRAIDSVPDEIAAASCVWAAGVNSAGTLANAVYEIVGILPMANVPAVTSPAWRTMLPVRPATLCTGARLDTAAVPYEAIWNWAALVEIVMPSPAVNWNVPKEFVDVPGATTNPAGPMPPPTVTGTDAPTLLTAMATAVPPDTLTPAAVLETTTFMLMGRTPSVCPKGTSW
jgi:hypothetical protein